MDTPTTQESQPRSYFFRDLLRFALIALLIILPIRIFVAQPFIVNGASMTPVFQNGDYLIVDQISYQFQKPERGEVIVFQYPNDPSLFYIKRIIGLPGETVKLNDGRVTIVNDIHPNGLILTEPYLDGTMETEGTYTLGEGEYFVLGDNRDHSSDSRKWGPLEEQYIQGRPALRLYPFHEMSVYPGDYEY